MVSEKGRHSIVDQYVRPSVHLGLWEIGRVHLCIATCVCVCVCVFMCVGACLCHTVNSYARSNMQRPAAACVSAMP